MELTFVKAKSQKDIKHIFDHTIDAFSDSPDFSWTLEDIQHEVKDGWELYSVSSGKEVIAAIFFKKDGTDLYTKNTAIKMTFQGSGYSHKIKDFFEQKAKELGAKTIIHYCRVDNFRMYALNESHNYKKTEKRIGEDQQIVEWVKRI